MRSIVTCRLIEFITEVISSVTYVSQKRTVERPTTQSSSVTPAILDTSTGTDLKPLTTLMEMANVYIFHNTERLRDNETHDQRRKMETANMIYLLIQSEITT